MLIEHLLCKSPFVTAVTTQKWQSQILCLLHLSFWWKFTAFPFAKIQCPELSKPYWGVCQDVKWLYVGFPGLREVLNYPHFLGDMLPTALSSGHQSRINCATSSPSSCPISICNILTAPPGSCLGCQHLLLVCHSQRGRVSPEHNPAGPRLHLHHGYSSYKL